jgi:hypothetical protein
LGNLGGALNLVLALTNLFSVRHTVIGQGCDQDKIKKKGSIKYFKIQSLDILDQAIALEKQSQRILDSFGD